MHSIGHIIAAFTRKKLVLLAALGMLAAACGGTGIGPGSNPSPTPSEGMGFDVTVTENDHTVTMHPGQKLEVMLHAPNGIHTWSHSESPDTSILAAPVDPLATPARALTSAASPA